MNICKNGIERFARLGPNKHGWTGLPLPQQKSPSGLKIQKDMRGHGNRLNLCPHHSSTILPPHLFRFFRFFSRNAAGESASSLSKAELLSNLCAPNTYLHEAKVCHNSWCKVWYTSQRFSTPERTGHWKTFFQQTIIAINI